ncbi:MAG: hypothetical protein ACK52N_08450, partial [Lysobacteraceae bacterium]
MPAPRSGLAPLLLLLLVALLAGCATSRGPDLAALYARAATSPSQPPVVVIPGLMGSTLVDERSGEEIWPGSLPALACSDYARLARIGPEWESDAGFRAGAV